jgi:hypothetical protein
MLADGSEKKLLDLDMWSFDGDTVEGAHQAHQAHQAR